MTRAHQPPGRHRPSLVRNVILCGLVLAICAPIYMLVRIRSTPRGGAAALRAASTHVLPSGEDTPSKAAAEASTTQDAAPRLSEVPSGVGSVTHPLPTVQLDKPLVQPWAPESSWDLYVSCTPELCQRHMWNAPPSWWHQVAKWGFRVVYVVGDGATGATRAGKLVDSAAQLAQDVPAASLPVAIMAVNAPDGYPPIHKEVAMLKKWREEGPVTRPFVHVDADALVVPRRLLPMLKAIPAHSDAVYQGRPASSCECNHRELDCTYKRATHYCSGAFYITTRPTLRRVLPEDFKPAPNGTKECKSSDLTVGYMMNNLGLHCAPLRDAAQPHRRYPGETWPMREDSSKYTVTTPICQEIGQPGGVHVKRTVTHPWSMRDTHRRECVVYHPVKMRHDVQFVWNHLHNSGDDVAAVDEAAGVRMSRSGIPGSCPIAIYMPVLPQRFDIRQVVRLTWGKAARALGIKYYFVAGMRPGKELRMTRRLLESENATHGDLLLSPYEESYTGLPFKTMVSLGFAATSGCNVFMKMDPDTYLRPYQAIKMMEVLDAGHEPGSEFYVGHVWDAKKTGKPNVQHDPTSPWYTGFNGDFYPPFCSGYAYLLSTPLAARTYQCLRPVVRSGAEDVQTGLCVHKVASDKTHIIHSSHMDYSRPCDAATVADNAVATPHAYNMLQRHEAHISNDFCQLGQRKFSAGLRDYPMSVSDFTVTDVSPDAASRFIMATPAPWETLDPKQGPDQFIFQEMTDVERSQFKMSSKHAKGAQKAFQTLARHTSNVVKAYRCVGCMASWYATLHVTKDGLSGKFSQAVAVNADHTAAFGYRRPLNTKYDLSVPHGCQVDKLLGFAQQLREYASWDMHLITTAMACGENRADDDPKAMHAALVKATGFGAERVHVIDSTDHPFHRAPACNLLHRAARAGSIIVLSDVDMELHPEFFFRSSAFVRAGVSAYFPIVFSRYDPNTVALSEAFYKRKVNRELQGRWRPYGYGNYVLAAEDAKVLLMDERFKGWGGEDNDFVQRVRSKLHVLRSEDFGIIHTFHGKDCSAVDPKRWKSCIGAAGSYSGSPLAMYLQHVAGFQQDGSMKAPPGAPPVGVQAKPPPPPAEPDKKKAILEVETDPHD